MIETTEQELEALRLYQSETHSTAIYPQEQAMQYLGFGLLNEIAEFMNAENPELATHEIGDMLWFISELANLIGADLSLLLQEEEENWTAPVADHIAAAIIAVEFADISGALAKHIRDGSPYSDQLYIFLRRAIQTVFSMVDVMSAVVYPDDPNSAFEHLLVINRTKLLDRQQRGVLGGSGNKR